MNTTPENKPSAPSENPPRVADPVYEKWDKNWRTATKRLAQEEGLTPGELAKVREKNRRYVASKMKERRAELDVLAREVAAKGLPEKARTKIEREIANLESVFERISTHVLQGTGDASGAHAASFVEGAIRSELSLKAMKDAYMDAAPDHQPDAPVSASEPVLDVQPEPTAAEPVVEAVEETLEPVAAPNVIREGYKDRVRALREKLAQTVQAVDAAAAREQTRKRELFATASSTALERDAESERGAYDKPMVKGFMAPDTANIKEAVAHDGRSRSERIRESVAAEKQAMMDEIERHALLHKETFKKSSVLDRMFGKGRNAKGYEQNRESKARVDQARLAYAQAVERATREQLMGEISTPEQIADIRADHAARGIDPEVTEREIARRTPEQAERILARHSRMVRTLEVSKPFIERMNLARIEGREEKKNWFEKTYGKFQLWEKEKEGKIAEGLMKMSGDKMSEENAARTAKVIWRSARVLGFATAGVTAVSLTGVFGLGAAVVGGAAYFGKRVAGIAFGALYSVIGADVYEETGGKRAAGNLHETTKKMAERRQLFKSDGQAELTALDEAVRHGSREAVARKKARIEAALAAALGAGSAGLISLAEAADTVSRTSGTSDGGIAVTPGTGNPGGTTPPEGDLRTPGSGTAPGAEAPPAGAAPAETVTVGTDPDRALSVSGNINNADRLVGHFGVKLQGEFADTEPPASVKKLFELLKTEEGASLLKGEDQATLLLGLQTLDKSAIMQPGDTISLNAEGDIVIDRPGHPELRHVLIDRTGALHTDHGLEMRTPGTGAPETVVSPASEDTAPSAAEPREPDPLQDSAASAGATTRIEPAANDNEPVELVGKAPVADAPTLPHSESAQVSSEPEAQASEQYLTRRQYNAGMRPGSGTSVEGVPAAVSAPTTTSVTGPEDTDELMSRREYNAMQRPEAVADPLAGAPRPIAEVVAADAWDQRSGASAMSFLRNPALEGSTDAFLRKELFDVMRESGVGPQGNETLSAYIARANETMSSDSFKQAAAANDPAMRPGTGVYQGPGGRLFVHGGDYNARMLVALEHLRTAPTATLLVEDPGKDDLLEFSNDNVRNENIPTSRIAVPDPRTYTAKVA